MPPLHVSRRMDHCVESGCINLAFAFFSNTSKPVPLAQASLLVYRTSTATLDQNREFVASLQLASVTTSRLSFSDARIYESFPPSLLSSDAIDRYRNSTFYEALQQRTLRMVLQIKGADGTYMWAPHHVQVHLQRVADIQQQQPRPRMRSCNLAGHGSAALNRVALNPTFACNRILASLGRMENSLWMRCNNDTSSVPHRTRPSSFVSRRSDSPQSFVFFATPSLPRLSGLGFGDTTRPARQHREQHSPRLPSPGSSSQRSPTFESNALLLSSWANTATLRAAERLPHDQPLSSARKRTFSESQLVSLQSQDSGVHDGCVVSRVWTPACALLALCWMVVV